MGNCGKPRRRPIPDRKVRGYGFSPSVSEYGDLEEDAFSGQPLSPGQWELDPQGNVVVRGTADRDDRPGYGRARRK